MTRRNSSSFPGGAFRLSLVLFAMLLIFAPPAVPGPPSNAQPQPAETPQPEEFPPVPRHTQAVDEWGEITVAQPKIWQYERVNALLDGLLRDVEGVSLSDLTRLDPSAQNAAAVRFVQSAMGIAVQYDQAAQVNSANILQTWQTQHAAQVEQLQQYNQYITTLNTQRTQTASQLLAAETTVATLQGQTDANGQLPADQQKQLVDAQNRVTALNNQLTTINNMITSAGPAPTLTAPPTPQGTSASSLLPSQPALSSFADILKALPDGVQKGLTSALQSPSYPASKQLDNFITLLHERLAREISVQQDDLLRDPDNLPFLLQFDIGLYPSKKAKNHMARVEFDLINCPGCKVYSVYPGQSAYNVANYQGASHRRSFVGNLMTLIGLGITASYQRQEDALQGSLVQSVYISGFQDDMNSGARPNKYGSVAQSFGWYYNAAPFDQYVTPGIRSTFALITVPRKLVQCFQGQPDADCPRITSVTSNMPGSTSTDKETASSSKPHPQTSSQEAQPSVGEGALLFVNESSHKRLPSDPEISTTKKTETSHPELKTRSPQPYPISLNVAGDWARRDDPLYQDSGWLSKRYLGAKHKTGLQRTLRVNLPGTEVLNAPSQWVLQDKQRLHILRMEYNTVTVRKVIASASPSPTPSPTPIAMPGAAANLCGKRECASVLLSLDVPIDPNLVVTVRGNLLPRVRDWLGRATSVLPPAQSTSDLAPSTSGGSLPKTQNPVSRSLLEADQLQADSWYAVTSHDLLLNISHRLAGDEEFPVIQLSVPGKQTLVIPNDLQQNTTELITDSFRFLPPGQVQQHILRTLALQPRDSGLTNEQHSIRGSSPTGLPSKTDQSISGPFPYATFMPLFQKDLVAKRFYAIVGQTRKDLIIGFLKQPRDESNPGPSTFLETRTLGILEDPDLDLAWALSCEKQGEELICHLPLAAIRQGYQYVDGACTEPDELGQKNRGKLCPAIESRISRLPKFVSGLQLWIEQYDPDGDNAFWSPEPVKIGLLPISEDYALDPGTLIKSGGSTITSAGFKPWHFDSFHTTPGLIGLEECNYFGDDKANVSYLTPIDFVDPQNYSIHPPLQESGHHDNCKYIQLPTSTLEGPEIVLQMTVGESPSWTAAIPTAQLQPEFRHPSVLPSFEKRDNGFGIESWTVSTPVVRMHSKDRIAENLTDMGIDLKLLDGDHAVDPNTCSELCPPTWWAKQQAGQIQLQLTIPKSAALKLPQILRLIRTEPLADSSPQVAPKTAPGSPNSKKSSPVNDGVNVTVATLSYIRDLLLPTKLKLEMLGDSQFALRGRNAGAIDAVALQSAGKTVIYPAGAAGELAVIDTTPPPVSKTPVTKAPKAPTSGAQKPSPNSPAPASAKNGKSGDAASALPAGTYAVLPLIRDDKGKYFPIAVTDNTGAPLVFTKKATAKTADDSSATKPDETITITKTTAKPAISPTPPSTPK